MATRKAESNVQLVKRLMEYSKHGALAQLFIMDAIAKQARLVAVTPPDELRAAFGQTPFISSDSWQAVAREIHAEMEGRGK